MRRRGDVDAAKHHGLADERDSGEAAAAVADCFADQQHARADGLHLAEVEP